MPPGVQRGPGTISIIIIVIILIMVIIVKIAIVVKHCNNSISSNNRQTRNYNSKT